MILFLHGPDTYRSRQKLNEITARYRAIHISGMNFKILDAYEDKSFDVFKNSIQTTSMFSEKKLVVTKGGMNAKEFARLFLLWAGKEALQDSRDAVCVFYDEVVDKRSEMFRWLKENSAIQEFTMLSGAKLLNWIRKYTQKDHINCGEDVLWKLVAGYGGNLWAITNELKKLKAYKKGGSIAKEDLDIFMQGKNEENAFALADALVYGEKARALKLFSVYGDSEDEARRIFGLLCWRVRKSVESRRFDGAKLKKIYRQLIDMDVAVKTGRFGAKYALENFIFET